MNTTLTKKTLTALAALAVGLGLVATGAGSAVADDSSTTGYWTPQGTSQPWFIYSLDTGVVVPAGTTLHYDDGVVGAPSATDPEQTYDQAPADATGVRYFISPRGQETDRSAWLSNSDAAFISSTDRRVLQPTSSLYQFPAGTFAAVKAAGGDYSIGIAYTKNNNVTIVGTPAFTYIHIATDGSGDWTFVTPEWVDTTPVPTTQTGQIGIEATTVGATDGALSLSVPSGAKATLGTATLVNNLSTSTGTLPTFTVDDGRVVSKPGWTVNTSATDFAGPGTFPASALTVAPAVVASGTTSTGVTPSGSFAFAGSNAAHQFADAAAGSGTGVTNLNAGLTLTAPATATPGTYTSTLTVTVVSK